jgi:KDO2-lipid IV(A) lauroyltransferase
MSRKRKKLPPFLHTPLYVAVRGLMSAVLLAEVEPTVQTVRALARTYADLPFNRKRLARAIDHIAVAFPHWSAQRRHDYAVKSYEHLFSLAVETAVMPRLLSDDGWPAHLRLGGMADAVRYLVGPGPDGVKKPCVLITGHTGNWELLGYAMALIGFPMHALFRPLDLKPLNTWIERTRQRRGLVLVDKFGATVELPRLMEQGLPVGFVADQNGGDRGLFVPFFDRLSSAYKSIGLLALQYNAPIVCGQARRVPPHGDWVMNPTPPPSHDAPEPDQGNDPAAFTYELDVVDVIRPQDWANEPDPLFYVTARYRRAIETMVRRAPEQYLWMHRYWKSRPRHERLGRPMPDALKEKIARLPWMTPDALARVMDWSERDTRALQAAPAHRA